MRIHFFLLATVAFVPAEAAYSNHRYMSTNSSVQSATNGKANWDPTDAVTVSGSLRANGGTNCGNTGPLANLSSYDVRIFPPTGSLSGGHHRCGGDQRGARDNAEMESFNGRFKTENRELFAEAASLEQLVTLAGRRMHHYNSKRRHSSIGNMTPAAYVRQHRGEE